MIPTLRILMRRIAAALVVPLIAAGAIAGCGSSSSSSSSGPNATVAVSGQFGKAPQVQIPSKKAGADLAIKTEIHGSGPTIQSEDAVLGNFAIYVWSGTTHKLLDSTFTSSPQVLPAQMGLPGLAKALHGQKTGSRVLAVLPPKYGYGTQGNSQIGITPTDTTVWVVDLIRAFSPTSAAAGTRVSSGGGSLPTVSNAPAGAPTITIPKAAPPSKLVVKTLIQGTGPKLADGQTIVAQVVGTNWRTKKVFYSTWPTAATPSGAPFSFVLGGQVIPGWNKGLVGIPAGSRVMLIVPPADGYGKSGDSSAGIKSTDTLVFVVDILDAVSGTAS
jgi:FKBP-type peptidyl-prolyl cis-trans isomerase